VVQGEYVYFSYRKAYCLQTYNCVEKVVRRIQDFTSKDTPSSSNPFIKREFILPSPAQSNMGCQGKA